MSEVPIFTVPERGLRDHEIENRPEALTPQDHIDLWEQEMTGSWMADSPEVKHDSVQPPTFEIETRSHKEQLQESINAMPEHLLVGDVAGVGRAVGAARQYALAA